LIEFKFPGDPLLWTVYFNLAFNSILPVISRRRFRFGFKLHFTVLPGLVPCILWKEKVARQLVALCLVSSLGHNTCVFLSDQPDVPCRQAVAGDVVLNMLLGDILGQASDHNCVIWGCVPPVFLSRRPFSVSTRTSISTSITTPFIVLISSFPPRPIVFISPLPPIHALPPLPTSLSTPRPAPAPPSPPLSAPLPPPPPLIVSLVPVIVLAAPAHRWGWWGAGATAPGLAWRKRHLPHHHAWLDHLPRSEHHSWVASSCGCVHRGVCSIRVILSRCYCCCLCCCVLFCCEEQVHDQTRLGPARISSFHKCLAFALDLK